VKKRATCPCCGRTDVELVGNTVLETHYRPNGYGAGPRRAGPYCNGSGYTLEQARRWNEMSPADKDRRLSSVWSVRAEVAS
jgi:predicted Fe-S protein YdhL (DUF1289 family)